MSAEAATAVATATEPVPVEQGKEVAVDSVPEPTPAVQEKVEDKPNVELTAGVQTPLSHLFRELPSIIKEADYSEMWGVELKDVTHVPTSIVLEKFLRANVVDKKKDIAKAKAQLIEALKWRKKMEPRKLMDETEFDEAKFGNLGYVTVYGGTEGKEIVTWNIYGGVKDIKGTFGNVEE